MTNEELHHRFIGIGTEHRKLKNKLIAMLPEIKKRGVFREHGCASVYEYARKYAGLSGSVVEKALWVEKKLEDKPALRATIAEVGVHKVAMVATLATPENEALLADKVKHMSKAAVVEMAKELRYGEVKQRISIDLDDEMQFLFLKLKKKMGVESNKEVLRLILQQSVENGKDIPGRESKRKQKEEKVKRAEVTGAASRYIPARKKRQAIGSGKCSYPGCNKPYEQLHHPDYFARTKKHENLRPLCKSHHEFMHNGLVEGENPKQWRLNLGAHVNSYDEVYRRKRQ